MVGKSNRWSSVFPIISIVTLPKILGLRLLLLFVDAILLDLGCKIDYLTKTLGRMGITKLDFDLFKV
jgi:hypothetical protein